jgi:hypothetical protein
MDLMYVQVYWNLHKNIWSIRNKGKVIAHRNALTLSDVTFRVQPAGRDRVRREGKKNVHAFACGTFDTRKISDSASMRKITYNPYKFDSFVYEDDLTPVTKCDRVVLSGRNVWEVTDV